MPYHAHQTVVHVNTGFETCIFNTIDDSPSAVILFCIFVRLDQNRKCHLILRRERVNCVRLIVHVATCTALTELGTILNDAIAMSRSSHLSAIPQTAHPSMSPVSQKTGQSTATRQTTRVGRSPQRTIECAASQMYTKVRCVS